jgi:hypothetical protein
VPFVGTGTIFDPLDWVGEIMLRSRDNSFLICVYRPSKKSIKRMVTRLGRPVIGGI